MFKWTQNKVVTAALFAALPLSTYAQDAGRFEFGQFDIVPTMNASMSYVDNVAYARSDLPEIFSWRSIISPEVIAATEVNGNPIQLGYRLERGVYFSSSADDYTDHFFEGAGDFELNSRHRINALAQFEDGHEDRGTGFSLGLGTNIATPDRYKSTFVGGEYMYGAVTSDGMLTIKADRQTLDYDRSELQYLIRDRVVNRVGAELSYRIGSATNAVIDLTQSYVRYDNQTGIITRDSDETRLLVGVTWESSAATTGYAKVGYQEKDFKAASRSTFYGTDWEVGVEWQPVTYSTINLSTSADTRETNGEGNFIRGRDYSVSWRHEWLQRLSTSLRVARVSDEYISGDDILDNRDDELMRYSASLDYDARRWLSFSLFYQLDDRDSNRALIGYDRNVVGISAEVTL